MKLINRRSAIMALTKQMSDGTDYRNEIVEQCIDAIRKLKVHNSNKRKIGRWIVEENPAAGRCLQKVYVCNICGSGVGCGYFNRRSFCPACGSEMEDTDGTPLTLDRYEEWKKKKSLEEEQQRQAQLEFCRSFREEDAKAAGGAPVCGAKMEVEK